MGKRGLNSSGLAHRIAMRSCDRGIERKGSIKLGECLCNKRPYKLSGKSLLPVVKLCGCFITPSYVSDKLKKLMNGEQLV
jgi:hypothetical protein